MSACAASASSEECAGCAGCGLRPVCFAARGHRPAPGDRAPTLPTSRITLARGAALFRDGDAMDAVYAVRRGALKTQGGQCVAAAPVIGFLLAGDVLGLDGIDTQRHRCDAIAITDAEVCIVPYAALLQWCHRFAEAQQQFNRLMSREIARGQTLLLRLGSIRAEQRVAGFLLDLSQRQRTRGLPDATLALDMTRDEIGAHLGLTIETVSRCFSKLQADGLLQVRRRDIAIVDLAALERAGAMPAPYSPRG